MSWFSLCEFNLFPRESAAKKKGKKWEVDDVQTRFIRTGLGHVLGFDSRNMLLSPQHKELQISWHITALQTDVD